LTAVDGRAALGARGGTHEGYSPGVHTKGTRTCAFAGVLTRGTETGTRRGPRRGCLSVVRTGVLPHSLTRRRGADVECHRVVEYSPGVLEHSLGVLEHSPGVLEHSPGALEGVLAAVLIRRRVARRGADAHGDVRRVAHRRRLVGTRVFYWGTRLLYGCSGVLDGHPECSRGTLVLGTDAIVDGC
jgi:hypothetical protein